MSADQLTPEQVAEYREAFSLFDKDGDGRVTAAELSRVFSSLGRHFTPSEIQEHLNSVDADQNGTIEFPEFLHLVARKGDPSESVKEITEVFEAFDKNGDGKISREELKKMMNSLGESLSDAEIDAMIKEADVDGNGEIELPEFIKIMSAK